MNRQRSEELRDYFQWMHDEQVDIEHDYTAAELLALFAERDRYRNALANMDSPMEMYGGEPLICMFCAPTWGTEHTNDCAWVAARKHKDQGDG